MMASLGDRQAMTVNGGSRPSTAMSDEPKEIWSSLLKSVSSHKSIPSRNFLVMGISLKVSLANEGGGAKGIGEFVNGLRITARHIGGGKETHMKHKRKRSGLPDLEGTLALGYTYIDILDEENDGTSAF
jgi:hypothetical protein